MLLHAETATWRFNWYVFNLADVAIVAGVVGLLYESLLGGQRPKSALIPGLLGPKAANCREFKGFGCRHDELQVQPQIQPGCPCCHDRHGMVIGCAGSFAQAADDDDDELLDTKIFRGILKGLGLRKDERPASSTASVRRWCCRPARNLPPPEADAAAKKAAGWPDDPDIKRAKTRKEAERKRKGFEQGVDDKPLLPSQMAKMRPPADGSKAGEAPGKSAEAVGRAQHECRIGLQGLHRACSARFGRRRKNTSPFTGEPPRSSLIEPPPGYRTPSPDPALWRRPRQVGARRSIDKNEPAK